MKNCRMWFAYYIILLTQYRFFFSVMKTKFMLSRTKKNFKNFLLIIENNHNTNSTLFQTKSSNTSFLTLLAIHITIENCFESFSGSMCKQLLCFNRQSNLNLITKNHFINTYLLMSKSFCADV